MLLPQLIISILLFMVLFFGIGFVINMLIKTTWFPTWAYPMVIILVVEKMPFINYFTNANAALSDLGHRFISLTTPDIIILFSGFIGAIASGITIKILRVRGYQMF